jgi:hypothetical protein
VLSVEVFPAPAVLWHGGNVALRAAIPIFLDGKAVNAAGKMGISARNAC